MNKNVLAWCLFDFANSSFSAVIAAVVFPVYYTAHIVGNDSGQGDLWWGRAIAASMAIVAVSSPFLGGIADYAGIKKRLLILYTALCIAAVASFTVLRQGMVVEGFFLIVLATVGLEGGTVFYNAFLPEIAGPQQQGRVSAWGFAIGYAGSILSLLIALALIENGVLVFVWPMVALFFGIFSLPAFLILPRDSGGGAGIRSAAVNGFRQSMVQLRRIVQNRDQRRFLLAFLIYEDGVNTVIVFSSVFAATTLGFAPRELVLLYLVVQVTALAGAFALARPIDVWGPKRVVLLSLCLWTTVAVAAFFITSKAHFFFVASCAGLGLGTIQAASRAFYVQFIPPGKSSEYFGVYSMVGKTSAVLGPLIFGYLSTAFNSQRPAVLAISSFFVAGLAIVMTVRGGGPNSNGRNAEDSGQNF